HATNTLSLHDALPISRKDAVHPPRSGRSPSGWSVVSKANTALASIARLAPAKIAAIPTSAATRTSIPAWGATCAAAAPTSAPIRSEEHTSELQSLRHL